ncbi:hypothetical protein MVEN_01341700 [Mycena venus]|uniref:Prokineticin domain-containing protein n=1 Tax=Mycena venus TaxID=2733690 RepID=A0A8H6XY02_9AGAR|nr:hypothetical protein MVEN_01341700 [Mycena venus]
MRFTLQAQIILLAMLDLFAGQLYVSGKVGDDCAFKSQCGEGECCMTDMFGETTTCQPLADLDEDCSMVSEGACPCVQPLRCMLADGLQGLHRCV